MSILDLLIIYLACGAPFAVYNAYRDDPGSRAWMVFAVTLVFWPVVGVKTLLSANQTESAERNKLDSIRNDIEGEVFPAGTDGLFAFREVFDRYCGLAEVTRMNGSPASAVVLEIAGHPSQPLAEVCLTRTQRRRLERHLFDAREEFAAILAPNEALHLHDLIERLATVIDDPDLPTAVSAACLVRPERVETGVSVV